MYILLVGYYRKTVGISSLPHVGVILFDESYTVLLLIFYSIFPLLGLIFQSRSFQLLLAVLGLYSSLWAFFSCTMRHCHCGGFSCFGVYCVFKMPYSSRTIASFQAHLHAGDLVKVQILIQRVQDGPESPLQTGSQVVQVMLDALMVRHSKALQGASA